MDRYGATWDPTSTRSAYGLECAPRSVKWRAFNDALAHAQQQSADQVDGALRFYASQEAAHIAEQKRRDDEAAQLAQARADAANRPVEKAVGITDDQLRMVHNIVKSRLANQFADIRTAFRKFDTDVCHAPLLGPSTPDRNRLAWRSHLLRSGSLARGQGSGNIR